MSNFEFPHSGQPMRYLDPKNDLTFKKVFGQHPHLLRSLLNALLPLEPDAQIASLGYLPAELVPEIPQIRNSIVHVRCADQRGRQFIVEMQVPKKNQRQKRLAIQKSKGAVTFPLASEDCSERGEFNGQNQDASP